MSVSKSNAQTHGVSRVPATSQQVASEELPEMLRPPSG